MLYNAYNQKLSGSHSRSKSTRSRKDPVSYLNIMLVGSIGSGKTAFVRTFCETLKHDIIQGSYKESKPMVMKEPLQSTRELYKVSMHIEDNGQRTALTLIDTPGFTSGLAIDHQIRYIAKYIDYQFERTLAEESKVRRDAKALDTHIHTCLYFIDIYSINGLSEADKCTLKKLSARVNIVPVIGKADTLTTAQINQLKTVFRQEAFDILQIPVYGFIEVDDDDEEEEQHSYSSNGGSRPSHRNKILEMLHEAVEEDKDEDAMAMIDYLQNMPFTLIAYEEDAQTGRPISITSSSTSFNNKHQLTHSESVPNFSTTTTTTAMDVDEDEEMTASSPTPMTEQKKLIKEQQMINDNKTVLGRAYPWAVVECCNPSHCDFINLKNILLSGHRNMLRIDTFERFYEQYRTEQLLNRKVSKIMRLESKEGAALV